MALGSSPESGSGERFEPTHWSVVLAAGREADTPEPAQTALTELCRTYWPPLYGFVRGRGYSLHDAQDLTQGFFCHLIEHRIYTRVDQTRGKFRSFLLTAIKNFLNNLYEREHALKRGGGCEFLPLHEEQAIAAEVLFQSTTTPEMIVSDDHLFERQWAETLIATTLGRLAAEYEAEGKATLYRALEAFVQGSVEPLPSYEQLGPRLGVPVGTARSHVHRLRARYREILRAELRRTVGSEAEVDGELRELLRVLTAAAPR